MKYDVDILLFDEFETLDVFGPVQILGCLPEIFNLNFISAKGGIVRSTQNTRVVTDLYIKDSNIDKILLIPGGVGTREKVDDEKFIDIIKSIAEKAKYIICICTGSALLAKSGVLDGKKATSNKRSFNWVKEQGKEVYWINEARWIKESNIYTSSGVSAGIDMTLGFIQDIIGKTEALEIAKRIEYCWNEDSYYDPFSNIYNEIII